MNCLMCSHKLDIMVGYYEDGLFITEYICPDCGQLHHCTSQSGDMIQENLSLEMWGD
jgi:DNA-directed RNA polymerase subunit RPC12/RpoP